METTKHIYTALANIMAAISPIAKNRENKEQKYLFRGIDDVYNELHAHFSSEKVVIVPRITARETNNFTNKYGTLINHSIVEVEYTFVSCVDGSTLTAVASGEAYDSSDKALKKALSAALSYVLFQMFLIPTNEPKDSENDHIERTVSKPESLKAEPTAQPQLTDEIKEILRQCLPNMPKETARKLTEAVIAGQVDTATAQKYIAKYQIKRQ